MIACPDCRWLASRSIRATRPKGAGRMVMVRTAPLTYEPPTTHILPTACLRDTTHAPGPTVDVVGP